MEGSALLAKLGTVANLRDDERDLLLALCHDVRTIPAKQHIIHEGDRPEQVHLIVDGWAARYKQLPDGSRQIVAFLIPGDFCDLHTAVLDHMDHAIVAITRCRVAFIQSSEVDELTSNHNGLTRALWWSTLVDEAVLRSWIVNHGRRDAYHRVAHLICELHLRLKVIGLVRDGRFDLPLTQEDIGDATGLTSVHTNRTLQRLRKQGLIQLESRALTVVHADALQREAGFDPSYLHIKRRLPARR